MKLLDDYDMSKTQIAKIDVLFKKYGINCINVWTMLTNGSSVLLKLVFTTIAGKHKGKLRRKGILPLKTEQLHLQRGGIFCEYEDIFYAN